VDHRMSLILLSFLILLTGPVQAGDKNTDPDVLLGIWETEHEEKGYSRIEITREGDRYQGKIVWLSNPTYLEGDPDGEVGTPILDIHNPDESRRTQTLDGLQLLHSFRFNKGDGKWVDGRIYDPTEGKEYRCKITLKDADTLEVYGYVKVGFVKLGRDTAWIRVPDVTKDSE